MSFDWSEASSFVTVAAVVAGLVVFMMRSALNGAFVEGRAFTGLVKRVDQVEIRIQGMASSSDLRELALRISQIEVSVAANGGQLLGVSQGVARVERMVDLLVRNELQEDKE